MNHEPHEKHKIIIFKGESYKIQGAVFKVYRIKEIVAEHKARVINYLKATEHRLGLLINFGSYPKASITRLVL
ncbi:MAG: hypothetical protein A2464_01170 [Deltaproteobacteria bacterium RIFOXYC2_FULL_48_10]|nr:GxxExxY protein [Desulfobacteraceae bacterium]OGQ89166.1 MAG: hypothetical protein A2464_01170 [Deltaproteobacteria bacterium RIFOXYC2_FULL_48_10]